MKTLSLTKSFFKLLFIISIPVTILSCGGGSDDDNSITPNGDYIKFKLDGKEVSIIRPNAPAYVKCRFYRTGNIFYQFMIQGQDEYSEYPNLTLQSGIKEKYVVDKEYNTDDRTDDSRHGSGDFHMPTGDLITKSIKYYLNSGITIKFTEITDDRVKGTFTANANKIVDKKFPAITDGEFSARRED